MANLDDPKTQAVLEYYRVWDAGDFDAQGKITSIRNFM